MALVRAESAAHDAYAAAPAGVGAGVGSLRRGIRRIRRVVGAGGHRAERGEGMGLTICRRILTKYGGSLTVRSDSGETTFCGTFPAAAA